MIYNDPNGLKSSVDVVNTDGQFNLWHYFRKALIEVRNEQFFQQLADTAVLPKHYGKEIKRYHVMPLLDDRNINDQGIDADGVTILMDNWFVNFPSTTLEFGAAADATAAVVVINDNINNTDGSAETIASAVDVTVTLTETYVRYVDEATADAAVNNGTNEGTGGVKIQGSGSLYGGSKDIGLIKKKLPPLTENGGKVNRVGYTRKTIKGSITEYGFYSDYTKDSMQFDTDKDLLSQITTESVVAANEQLEDLVQVDLLEGAGVIRYAGIASSNATIIGEGATPSILTFEDIMHMNIDLTDNKCPKNTKMLTGTTNTDTKVIPACRYAYIGSELLPTLLRMKDLHNERAWVPVEQYAAAGKVAMGEAGSIYQTRFIEVPEMQSWQGAGAISTGAGVNDINYRTTGGRYDVVPVLFVGSGSFSTIAFKSSGKSVKFSIIHKKPGVETADLYNDPYGKKGFFSISWWYGTILMRTEWIGVIKTVAEVG